MSTFDDFSQELAELMRRLDAVCEKYDFNAVPHVVLLHANGPASSIVLGNGDLNQVSACITHIVNDNETHDKYVVVPDKKPKRPRFRAPRPSQN